MNKRLLLMIALVSLPSFAADVVIRSSAPTTTRSAYDRSVSLNAQITTLTLGTRCIWACATTPVFEAPTCNEWRKNSTCG